MNSVTVGIVIQFCLCIYVIYTFGNSGLASNRRMMNYKMMQQETSMI
jgi:hypothetical protein